MGFKGCDEEEGGGGGAGDWLPYFNRTEKIVASPGARYLLIDAIYRA